MGLNGRQRKGVLSNTSRGCTWKVFGKKSEFLGAGKICASTLDRNDHLARKLITGGAEPEIIYTLDRHLYIIGSAAVTNGPVAERLTRPGGWCVHDA